MLGGLVKWIILCVVIFLIVLPTRRLLGMPRTRSRPRTAGVVRWDAMGQPGIRKGDVYDHKAP